ncbi:MAG: TlpA disulfide reductase family protein [Ferruginibacter sp.]
MKQFIFLILILSGSIFSNAQASKDQLAELPDFKIVNSNGNVINIRDLANNKVAFINFWYIPCGPCFTEMSLLEKLYLKYKQDSNFIFISITASDPKAVKSLLTRSDSDTSMHVFFKRVAQMDTVTFPTWYLNTCMDIVTKDGAGMYDFHITPPERKDCPYDVFKFKGYPTSFISGKNKKILFEKTGVLTSKNDKVFKEICDLIDALLKGK